MKTLLKATLAALTTITIIGAITIDRIDTTPTGTLIQFHDGTGYYLEK